MTEINVVGAVITKGSKILCAQRSEAKNLGGLWEFPGGKIEKNETPKEALIREIKEELKCTIRVKDKITTAHYAYDFGKVVLTTFFCEIINGDPILTEHQQIKWLEKENLKELNWAPADIPTIDKLTE